MQLFLLQLKSTRDPAAARHATAAWIVGAARLGDSCAGPAAGLHPEVLHMTLRVAALGGSALCHCTCFQKVMLLVQGGQRGSTGGPPAACIPMLSENFKDGSVWLKRRPWGFLQACFLRSTGFQKCVVSAGGWHAAGLHLVAVK